ncbi:MAG: hypothetical protein ABJA67_14170 [Chthonomonadales bacterium]
MSTEFLKRLFTPYLLGGQAILQVYGWMSGYRGMWLAWCLYVGGGLFIAFLYRQLVKR